MEKNHSFLQGKLMVEEAMKNLKIYHYFLDSKVTEILINTDNSIWVKKIGEGFIDTGERSESSQVLNILKTLASLNKVSLNEENPHISTELPLNKSRVEGLIPPVVDNPKFNIRKKIPITKNIKDYLNDNFITKDQYDYLVKSVKKHKNILVIGGTDTGKTTFVNALISIMDNLEERLIILEEVQELQTKAKNVDRIKIIPGLYSARDALKSCMRLSPERIIFGELRGEEAYDFINGLNSGHPGGVSTIHANDGMGGLKKLETYVQMGIGKPMSELIGMTVNILIVLKMKNNIRYLDEISEIMEYEDKKYKLKTIFKKEEV